jgi:hypothetical protein
MPGARVTIILPPGQFTVTALLFEGVDRRLGQGSVGDTDVDVAAA